MNANAVIERLRQAIEPNPDQISNLQRLGRAIDTAAAQLANSCPAEIPREPTARLQLMLRQIEALTSAIDLIRQPLQNFEDSLTQEQKARLAAAATSASAPSRQDVKTEACRPSSAAVDRSAEQIEKSVEISNEQRSALNELHQALSRAAAELEAHCSASVPQSAMARLDTLEARLDATWRAILSIQVALYNFDSNLSADQKNRLKTMTFAAQD